MGGSGSVPPGRGVSDGSERHAVNDCEELHTCTLDKACPFLHDCRGSTQRAALDKTQSVLEVPVTNSTRRNVEHTRRVIR